MTLRGGGVIRGWSSGVFLTGARCRVEDLTIVGSETTGLQLHGPDGVVRRCAVVGHAWEGLHLGPDADGASVLDCRLRDNTRHQVLSEGDGSRIEGCSITAKAGVTQPLVAVLGAGNVLRGNSVTSGAVGERALDVSGDGNRLLENVVRLTDTATFGVGVAVTGSLNEIRGGHLTVAPTLGTALRFDQPSSVVAVRIGLLPGADEATGIRANAPGYLEQNNLTVASAESVGIDVQGDAANVGTTLSENRIRVAGAGSRGVRSLASASMIQGNGIVLDLAADDAIAIDVLGSSGGHDISGNGIVLAGHDQSGPVLNGAADLVRGNDVLVLGDGGVGILQFSGTTGMISDNRVRLDAADATGIFVPEFVGDLLTRNVVIGDGVRFDVGEGNAPSQIVANPGFGFVAEGVVNIEVGN